MLCEHSSISREQTRTSLSVRKLA